MQLLRKPWLRFKPSIAWAILLAMLVVSIGPIVLISRLFSNQSSLALNQQMEDNMQLLARTRADEMNLLLTGVEHTTMIAAQQAALVLSRAINVPEGALEQVALARYQPDDRNILGLDRWYQAQGGATSVGANLSNVYWDNRVPLPDQAARQLLNSEELDHLFGSIKSVNPDLQWIYMTTSDGLMRLYPWASNDHYPNQWDPRQVVFYQVAAPSANPQLKPRWTPPYVDFAGAGWLVTSSAPILSADGAFLGVMSQDITINQLQEQARSTKVLGGNGYGFLVDQTGNVVAHPQYQNGGATEGSQAVTNLLQVGSPDFRSLVQQMVNGQTGLGYFNDARQNEQLLVYAPIPSIGWSLGIVVPRTEVVAPAKAMQRWALGITLFFLLMAVLMAVLLTRLIHRPLLQLLQGVLQVTEDKQADTLAVNSFSELNRLGRAFNEMTSQVWERQTRLKREVADLQIEVDTKRQKVQLESIIDSDYFKHLEVNAERMRSKLRDGEQSA